MSDTATIASSLARDIVERLRSVAGEGPVALHEPSFQGNEWTYLKECLDSTFVSSVGKFVDQFEQELCAITGARRAIAVVNGTAALHIALQLAGVVHDDEVLVPSLTFIATANAIAYCGAISHFIDSDERTLGVDPQALREYLDDIAEFHGETCVNRYTGRVIRALVPVHTFGHPVDIEALMAIAHDFHITLVEDAAESLGTTLNGRPMGTFGKVAALSFNGNKTVTTGGGGAILTNDETLGRRAKHLTTTARVVHRWSFVHDEVGYNYRMPNLNAALGCAQLEQLPGMLVAKRHLFEKYREAFATADGVTLFGEPAGACSNYWLQALLLDVQHEDCRDDILAATNDAGLMTRPVWTLMHRLPMFAEYPRMALPVAESLERRIINIPSSSQLGVVRA